VCNELIPLNKEKPIGDCNEDSCERLLIEIGKPGEKLDKTAILSILNDTGVKVDPAYGPICVNPKLGRYVVRGFADIKAQAKLRQIPGVRIFRDQKVESTSQENF
jgi:hypothetical protein